MKGRTDVRLSESKVCEIVGVSQQQRQAFVGRGLLRKAPATGCTLHDALELAALTALGDRLQPSATATAWNQLRPKLRTLVPGRRLDVVFHSELGELEIARDDAELRSLVGHGRPVQVIELGNRLQQIGDAVRRWSAVAPYRPRRVRSQARDRPA